MRYKSFISIIFILVICSIKSFCSDKFTYGFKTGIGFWKLTNLTATHISYIGKYPLFPYSTGFSIGPFMENRLAKNIFLVNELLYQYSRVNVTRYTGIEGILEQNFETHCINVPILIKYQTNFLWQTSISLGPSFSYSIRSNYFSYDEIYGDTRSADITDYMPTIFSSIELGLGEKYEMTNHNILTELRVQIGLTKFKYAEIGNWQNIGLVFIVGLQIK